MKFADFVCFDAVIPKLNATDRDDVIAELIAALEKAGRLGKRKSGDITKSIIERENEASTGMGRGVAIPHVKHKSVKDMTAAVGLSSRGIDFATLDKKPVYSVLLLVSPADSPDKHLQAMALLHKV